MRRAAIAGAVLVGVLACRPDDGRIPITTRSEEARALYLHARSLNENLQVHEAHAVFRQAADLDRSFAMAAYQLASTAPTEKERNEHLQRALQLVDSVSPGERLLILSLQARRHGAPAMARQHAESLVARYPKDTRAHWLLGNSYLGQQQYEAAIVSFGEAIAIDSTYSLAYNQLGYAYRGAERMADAESAFRRYIALVPDDPNPYDSYAELLLKLGRFDESIAQYEKALSIDPHFAGSFVGIASAQMLAGRYPDAVAAADRYLSSARDDYERRTALLTRAMIHTAYAATDAALSAMEQRYVIAAAGGDTLSMSADAVTIGDILLAAGRVDAAAERFASAHSMVSRSGLPIEVREDDALGARYDAARVALGRGDLATARRESDAYAAGATTRGNETRSRQAYELQGLIALAAGEFDASLAALARADQQSPAVWLARSRAETARGDAAAAAAAEAKAFNMHTLVTFPYAIARASIAATRSATFRTARGTRH